jgi:hypothetical protein
VRLRGVAPALCNALPLNQVQATPPSDRRGSTRVCGAPRRRRRPASDALPNKGCMLTISL